MEVGKRGLDAITPILNDAAISTTLFTTANFAVHFPAEIKALAAKHEIASHTYYHSTFDVADLLSSKLKLEEISGKEVVGLRMPPIKKSRDEGCKRSGLHV
jgi:peptidoglycan/xylan/chitin deacetylase (PgdA/CDA1 family)